MLHAIQIPLGGSGHEPASRLTRHPLLIGGGRQQLVDVLHCSLYIHSTEPAAGRAGDILNALRGHLAEHGVIAPQGPAHLKTLAAAIDAAEPAMPQLVLDVGRVYLEQVDRLSRKIAELEKILRREAQCGEDARRIQTMPGIGPTTAMAVEAFGPPRPTFKRGRDFAAWQGLVPVQHSTGGKQRLGRTSKWANAISDGC